MIANIIDDSRCWVSDVGFRTAPPIGRLTCFERLAGYKRVSVCPSAQYLMTITAPKNIASSHENMDFQMAAYAFTELFGDRPVYKSINTRVSVQITKVQATHEG